MDIHHDDQQIPLCGEEGDIDEWTFIMMINTFRCVVKRVIVPL
jgi:hypothetical protein